VDELSRGGEVIHDPAFANLDVLVIQTVAGFVSNGGDSLQIAAIDDYPDDMPWLEVRKCLIGALAAVHGRAGERAVLGVAGFHPRWLHDATGESDPTGDHANHQAES
jgi:hypothetical protein